MLYLNIKCHDNEILENCNFIDIEVPNTVKAAGDFKNTKVLGLPWWRNA